YWGKVNQDASWGEYREVLALRGFIAAGLTPDQAAARVRASRVSGRLVAALDDGLQSLNARDDPVKNPGDFDFLKELLGRLDPDPVAAVVRANADDNLDRLRELARRADGAALQPLIAYRLIRNFDIPAADAHRILRAAA